ncbi:MAG: hypothetical protein KDJ31_14095 [Candidatus Competibacteraceae bacterium]|nr:hypothetical protein [Candidatus Competibacteraceae bacterium]HRY15539.1 hypothetical protein [Candidatus Competibacteraceae bacterium]
MFARREAPHNHADQSDIARPKLRFVQARRLSVALLDCSSQPLMSNETPTLGSQRLLQLAVNGRPELLQSALRKSGAIDQCESVTWISPLASESYTEYRDQRALDKLELRGKLSKPLREFWPARGPVWDALGVSSKGRPVIVEAKAHIPEAASPGTKAAPKSLELIEQSLQATRKYLAPRASASWTGTFYQYANRLAYQYFLRVLNSLDSSLVFLDFTNAVDMDGPATEEEWRGAIRMIHAVLGLPANLEYFGVYHAFMDARAVADLQSNHRMESDA